MVYWCGGGGDGDRLPKAVSSSSSDVVPSRLAAVSGRWSQSCPRAHVVCPPVGGRGQYYYSSLTNVILLYPCRAHVLTTSCSPRPHSTRWHSVLRFSACLSRRHDRCRVETVILCVECVRLCRPVGRTQPWPTRKCFSTMSTNC